MLDKFKKKLKDFINSIKIPPILSFFITKDGKINPTQEEVLKDAPEAAKNWLRLGLDKITSLGLPTWAVLLLPVVVFAIRYFSESLQFVINVISQFGVVIIFAVVLYFIYKNFFPKK